MEMLADRVRAAMEAAGMSQRALGQAIGFDPPTMSKALAGKRGFKPLELALISEALGISVQQLLADDEATRRRGRRCWLGCSRREIRQPNRRLPAYGKCWS